MVNNKVYDRGVKENLHANGTVSNGRYFAAAHDTFYSIGLRFGSPWRDISNANGLYGENPPVPVGTPIIIPGLVQTKPPVTKPPIYKPHTPKRPKTKPTTGAPMLGIISCCLLIVFLPAFMTKCSRAGDICHC